MMGHRLKRVFFSLLPTCFSFYIGLASIFCSNIVFAGALQNKIKITIIKQTEKSFKKIENLPTTIDSIISNSSIFNWVDSQIGPYGVTYDIFITDRDIEPSGQYRGQQGNGQIQIAVNSSLNEDQILGMALHEFGHVIFEKIGMQFVSPATKEQFFIFTSFNELFADTFSAVLLKNFRIHAFANSERDFTTTKACTEELSQDPHLFLTPSNTKIAESISNFDEGNLPLLLDSFMGSIKDAYKKAPSMPNTIEGCVKVNSLL